MGIRWSGRKAQKPETRVPVAAHVSDHERYEADWPVRRNEDKPVWLQRAAERGFVQKDFTNE